MKPAKTLVGQRFGNLTIVDNGPIYIEGSLKRFVEAQCDCGKIWHADEYSVIYGTTKRCRSCARKFVAAKLRMPPDSIGAWNTWFYRYKYNAKTRNLSWELSLEEFAELCQQECHYCGAEPTGKKVNRHNLITNGIDRKINSLGYSLDNSLPCCSVCNRMKHAMAYDEYVTHCNNIVRRLVK